MKVFRLTEFTLAQPITIIANDSAHASAMVIEALTKGFGRMPAAHYGIGEWITAVSSERDARAAENLVAIGEPGFVQEHDHYWDTHDPFDDF